MTEILRTAGILFRRSEVQQKKIRRILHYLTNFIAKSWVKIPSFRTHKLKITRILFYALLALVFFYIMSGRSRLSATKRVKNGGENFPVKNSLRKSKDIDLEGLKSQLNSDPIMFDKTLSSSKGSYRKSYKRENIGNEVLNSAGAMHGDRMDDNVKNEMAFQVKMHKNAIFIKSGDNPTPNPPLSDASHRQDKMKLYNNEGHPNQDDVMLVPGSSNPKNGIVKDDVNPHNYRLLINNERICTKGSKVSLFICVLSSAHHFEQRDAIRRTWGGGLALAPLRAKLAFFLASPPPQEAFLQDQIMQEAQTYGDVIQEDFLDTYQNLTLKSIMALKWVDEHCPQTEYFMKTDDDIFVNVPKLLAFLQEQKQLREDFIVGCIKQHKSFAPVNLPSSFSMPPAHPLFVAGAGYVLTGGLVPRLHRASRSTAIIPVEDVYVTGHLATKVGAHPPLHSPLFTCGELLLDDCDAMQVFTGHRITPRRMMQIWGKINPVEYSDSPCFDF